MSYGFKIMVKGDYAAFNRPEMKVERVSYDVPTPGALEGLIKSVYWKPAIRYETDKNVHIAFGTSSNEFASESYDLNACYYLCKPFQADKVKAMLDRIGSDEIDRMRSVKLPDGQNVILRNVIYIDCASHIVTIHCTDGENIVSRNSFAEIESIFCSHSYFYTSTKGVIVNFYEITQQKSDLFIMSDGTHIPISRRKSRETLDAFAQFRFSDLRKGGEQ